MVDVNHDAFEPRDDDVLERVHTSGGDFDDFVERDEGGLERSDVDQELQESLELISALLDRLTTSCDTNLIDIAV